MSFFLAIALAAAPLPAAAHVLAFLNRTIGWYGRLDNEARLADQPTDVLDIGLVWIYLMELETRGSDQLPTGRIVEFPNSVVFDHSAGIRDVQERMLGAVNGVFDEYRGAIEQQHRAMAPAGDGRRTADSGQRA